MKIFANRKHHPKTTEKGNKITLIVTLISAVATMIGTTHPELSEVLKTHSYEFASAFLAIVTIIQVFFSAKKDN